MGRFDLNKMGKRIEAEKEANKKVELGKSYLNEASQKLRDTRKKTEYIELSQIVPNPDNKLSMERVPWLMQDIAMNGLLQPLVVSQMEDGRYMLYAGHQRFEAICKLHEQGKFPDTVEAKVTEFDQLNLPEEVSMKVRQKLILRSANIQRGSSYATDADRYVVIKDWKEIYDELRRCNVEVLEYGLEDETVTSEQIKGVKTRELVSDKVGISPAQVGKYERVESRGVEELQDALLANEINVAVAADVASLQPQEQVEILQKIKETREITPENKITGDDVLLAKDSLKKPQKPKKENKPTSDKAVTKKRINADLKQAFRVIKDAGDEVVLDEQAYASYLKHIEAINQLIGKAVGK